MLNRRTMIGGLIAATATASAAAVPQRYALYPDASTITFKFTTNGAIQTGTVPVQTADIRIDPRNLERSSADVTADIRNVRTGLLFMTQAIKSSDLLDAANHPLVRFKSTQVRLGVRGRISEGAEIDGDLTLRGVTRPITFNANLSRPAGSAPDDLSTLYVQLSGSLSRMAYGATGFRNLADDQVVLDIRAEIRSDA